MVAGREVGRADRIEAGKKKGGARDRDRERREQNSERANESERRDAGQARGEMPVQGVRGGNADEEEGEVERASQSRLTKSQDEDFTRDVLHEPTRRAAYMSERSKDADATRKSSTGERDIGVYEE
eukprot:6210766-Pleurochrysis_carterae.AAC.2